MDSKFQSMRATTNDVQQTQFLWLSPIRRVIDSLLLLFLVLQLLLFFGVRFRSGVRLGMTTYMKKSQGQSLMCSCAFFAFLIEASSMDISTFFLN
jgi:hypothetical protein